MPDFFCIFAMFMPQQSGCKRNFKIEAALAPNGTRAMNLFDIIALNYLFDIVTWGCSHTALECVAEIGL